MRRQLLPRDLGFEVRPGDEPSLFKWFLASFLFGNRISQEIAAGTWRVFVEVHGCDTPRKLCEFTHAQLVRMLGDGGYRRYDESTATRLSLLCRTLMDEYDGRILGIAEAAETREDFERRLIAFKGVGPVTLGIFMREAEPTLSFRD
ncbi:MAG: DNA methylase [Lysobacter sp.]